MIKKLINTKAYGVGEFLGYDPRYPGYFSAKFITSKGTFEIHNLKNHDIVSIYDNEI